MIIMRSYIDIYVYLRNCFYYVIHIDFRKYHTLYLSWFNPYSPGVDFRRQNLRLSMSASDVKIFIMAVHP